MSRRRVPSPVPYIVAVLLAAAFLGLLACSAYLVIGGRP